MIARLREVVMERSSLIHSRLLLTQLRNFGENESGRLEALSGHDDLLFAYGIALMSRSENYVSRHLFTRDEPGYGAESFRRLNLNWWPDAQDYYTRHKELLEQEAAGQGSEFLSY